MHLLSQVGTFQGQKSVQRSLHLGFELYRDWLCCVSLTTQFLFFTSSLTLCPIFLSPLYSHRLSPCLTFVCSLFSISLPPTTTFFFCFLPVALYAISAVYFAGVMVRLMLTLTPVVCMLSAVAFSSVFEHYMGDDTKREKPPAEDSSDEDDKRNSGNLYDKVKTKKRCFSWSYDSWSLVGKFVSFHTLCRSLYSSLACLLTFFSASYRLRQFH